MWKQEKIMSWDEWEMRLERQNDEKRHEMTAKYEIMRLEKKRWRGETWNKKKMRPERQAVTKRAKTRVKDIRKAWRWENKRWEETTKLRRVGKQEIRWNVKMKKMRDETWETRCEKKNT